MVQGPPINFPLLVGMLMEEEVMVRVVVTDSNKIPSHAASVQHGVASQHGSS